MTTGDVVYSLRFSLIKILPEPGFNLGSTAESPVCLPLDYTCYMLFSIYINYLIQVSNKLNFIMYADDTTIYFDLEDFEKDNLKHQINDELKRVNIIMVKHK